MHEAMRDRTGLFVIKLALIMPVVLMFSVLLEFSAMVSRDHWCRLTFHNSEQAQEKGFASAR